jgi:MscS family membrane protein
VNWLMVIVGGIFMLFLGGNAAAQTPPASNSAPTAKVVAPPTTCTTPRDATMIVFAWQQSNQNNLMLAARCLETTGRSQAELQQMAIAIKDVYDQRTIFVDMDKLSTDQNWVSPVTGLAQFSPDPRLPGIQIAKQSDGNWRWTKASLDHIEELHKTSFSQDLAKKMPKMLRSPKIFDTEPWQYLSLFLIFVVSLLVRKIIQKVIFNRIRSLAENFGQNWAASMVDVFASPGATLIMAGLLRVAYPTLGLPISVALVIQLLVRLLLIISVIWAVYRLVDVLAERMSKRAELTESKLDDQLIPLVRKSLKVVVFVSGVLFVLQNMNVNVSGLIASLGIGGLAFAFAAKDTLANFFGSIMIFIDHPFQIGDWIVVDGAEGVVEEVGFRSTRVRSFDDSLMTIPNAKFTDNRIHNYGRRRYRRSTFTLNLTYDTSAEQIQAFVDGIRAIICASPATRKDYYEIHFAGFGAHSLDIMVYFFFKVESWSDELEQRHYVLLEILRLAENLGVEFAFPTQTLLVDHVAQPGAQRVVPSPLANEKLGTVIQAFGPKGSLSRPQGVQLSKGYKPSSNIEGSPTEDASDLSTNA